SDGVERLHTRFGSVAYVYADAAARIHVLKDLQRVLRGREVVFWAVIVHGNLDVVLLDKLRQLRQRDLSGRTHKQRHAGEPGIFELVPNVGLVVLVEVHIATPHDGETRILKLLAGFADLIGSRIQRQVVGLDVHVFQAEALDHLDRFGARKLSEGIGSYAQLEANLVARAGGAEVETGRNEHR